MKRILIILLLAVAAFPAFAQMGSPIIIPLWPDGAPNDNGIVTEEGHPSPRSVDNVSKPELWVFPAFRPNGTVIIACPGGGYYYLEPGTFGIFSITQTPAVLDIKQRLTI